jgi:hypothetical protein
VKIKTLVWLPLVWLSLAALACSLFQPASTATPFPLTDVAVLTETPAGDTAVPPSAAPSEEPSLTPPVEPSLTPEVPPAATDTPVTPETSEPPALQFIAYVDAARQLLVTNVTGDVLGGTTQYTLPEVDGQVLEFYWSPSAEFIAFTASRPDNVHIEYVYAVGAGTPVDLGLGNNLAWSPDSTRLAFVRDNNLWQITLESGALQQLTLNGAEWAWGRPVYTPSGDALVAGGALYNDMGAQGNTSFWLYQIPLDGSGALTQLPGLAAQIEGRLPRDLQYSPDGAHLAFSTSWHISACASQADYFVMNADGSDRHSLVSPSLAAAANPGAEIYFLGFSMAWTPGSDGLLQSGQVRTCANFSGDLVAGPQLSIVNLSGAESAILPGEFDSLSFDRSATRIGVVARPDFAAPGEVRLYDLSGNLALTVGPGEGAALQP